MRRAFSASIYCRHETQILLVHHKKQLAWVPVGGELEAGESPMEAAVRELQEELGWSRGIDYDFQDVSPVLGAPLGFLGYEEHMAGPKGLHMNFAFLARAKTRMVTPCDEFNELHWVRDLSDVSGEIPPNVRGLFQMAQEMTDADPKRKTTRPPPGS